MIPFFPFKTYEEALLSPQVQKWAEGEIVHTVRKCGCDKCAHLLSLRVQRRKEYLHRHRNKFLAYNKAYQHMLRDRAEAKGRPRQLNLGWQSHDASIDADWEFYQSVHAYAKSKGETVSSLVKKLLQKEIKKGVPRD